MADDNSEIPANSDFITESYRVQIKSLIEKESQRRNEINHSPEEITQLLSLSLVKLAEENNNQLVPALMARLGPVRSALDGHGGSIVVDLVEFTSSIEGKKMIQLVLNLDGACISCGAAPGTLKGIQDDLLIDEEVKSVCFSSSMLQWFDELQREFVLKHGGVEFIDI